MADSQTHVSMPGTICDESTSLLNTSTHSLSVNCNKLELDGTTYRWIGNLEELKHFIENDMKLSGTWRNKALQSSRRTQHKIVLWP